MILSAFARFFPHHFTPPRMLTAVLLTGVLGIATLASTLVHSLAGTFFHSVITWSVGPEMGFGVGPFRPRWYGLLFSSGFLIGYQIMSRMMRREGRPVSDMEPLTLTMILGTLVGMRVGHCLFYDPVHYFLNPLDILKIWEGGYASHGAVVGIATALWLYARSRPQQPFLWIIDRIAITVALAAFLIRTGNFFNHEMIGKPTSLPWAVVFTLRDELPRHPSQMYEAFCYLAIFFAMRWIYNRYNATPPAGLLLGFFFVTIFGARFIIEFSKENQVLFEQLLPINMGQILSVPLVLLGSWLIWRALKGGNSTQPAHGKQVGTQTGKQAGKQAGRARTGKTAHAKR
jgi:phosphatidylglycerol---prolipoprotein diacylglyceryl transferase